MSSSRLTLKAADNTNLALPSSNIPLVLQNPLSHLVNVLPYVDNENDQNILSEVEKCIKDEMKTMPKIDYLENFPMPKLTFSGSELLKNEFERVESGKQIEEVDFTLEKIEDITPEDDDDINAIKSAISKCDTISQYNNINLVNLELQLKYGPNIWKDYVQNIATFKKKLEVEVDSVKKELDDLNVKRKYEQLQASDRLLDVQNRIKYMLFKNETLESECALLENDIRSIQRKKLKRL